MMKKPKLTVVGAGIGAVDLLTLQGKKALESADVVLYDALVNPALLDWAAPDAVKCFVGKRRGYKAYSQDDINEIIVEYAENCGHVVRLKGGDPFIFGRGREEMLYAAAHGLETAYVAGISSAIAAAGSIGIPMTYRSVSRSFWVMTATTELNELSPEIEWAANIAAKVDMTFVILMGLRRLQEIIALFKASGKGNLPVALVENATLANQQVIISTVDAILSRSEVALLNAPAVIVLGEVVRYHTMEQVIESLGVVPLEHAIKY